MKKRESTKIIYLFALIVNLTIFNYANKHSDYQEQVNINTQHDHIQLVYGDNFTQFEKAFPVPSMVLLEISRIDVPFVQKKNEFISVD